MNKTGPQFSRVDCVTADRGEPQVVGRPSVEELLVNPLDQFPVDTSL